MTIYEEEEFSAVDEIFTGVELRLTVADALGDGEGRLFGVSDDFFSRCMLTGEGNVPAAVPYTGVGFTTIELRMFAAINSDPNVHNIQS